MRRRPTDVEYVDLESQKDRDNPLVHSFEKVHTATEDQSRRQQLDGSWTNENYRCLEGDPNLVTAYALLTAAYCEP